MAKYCLSRIPDVFVKALANTGLDPASQANQDDRVQFLIKNLVNAYCNYYNISDPSKANVSPKEMFDFLYSHKTEDGKETGVGVSVQMMGNETKAIVLGSRVFTSSLTELPKEDLAYRPILSAYNGKEGIWKRAKMALVNPKTKKVYTLAGFPVENLSDLDKATLNDLKQNYGITSNLNITPNNANDAKAAAKGSISNKFIGFGPEFNGKGSTNAYRIQAGDKANTGDYNSEDTIFVSVPGKRGTEEERKPFQDQTIKEAIKAINAGATLITDSEEYVNNSDYNEGERRLRDNLKYLGHKYETIEVNGHKLGKWTKGEASSNEQALAEIDSHVERMSTNDYPTRTRNNAQWSDITIGLGIDMNTAGERRTAKEAGNKYIASNMDFLNSGGIVATPEDYADLFYNQVLKKGLPTENVRLNMSGNGIYSFPSNVSQEYLDEVITDIIKELQNKGITISEIRSGGQTGIDEAGIKAAQTLGINWKIVATNDYAFRGRNNKDVRGDKKAFLERFLPKTKTDTKTDSSKTPAYYEGDITPDTNTIFVFGSNPEGKHGAGAAKTAREHFGAEYGVGEGLTGNAYALPTKDLRVKENNSLKSIPKETIIESIKRLYETAKQNPSKQFKVAYRNTNTVSLNGYTGLEMIEMFKAAGEIPSNIVFSKEWVDTGMFNTKADTNSTQKDPVDSKKLSADAPITVNGERVTWNDQARKFVSKTGKTYSAAQIYNLRRRQETYGLREVLSPVNTAGDAITINNNFPISIPIKRNNTKYTAFKEGEYSTVEEALQAQIDFYKENYGIDLIIPEVNAIKENFNALFALGSKADPSYRQKEEERFNKIKSQFESAVDAVEDEETVRDVIKSIKNGIPADDFRWKIQPFFTEDEIAQLEKGNPSIKNGGLRVASASRRTDPVFHAKAIVKMLEENYKKPLTDPARINAIEVWSKHDGMPMQDILRACKMYRVAPMVSFSISTLGNTVLEPGVMKTDDLLEHIQMLIETGDLNPETTTLRVDPIVPGITNLEDIKHVIEAGKSMGIRKYVTSIMQSYGNKEGTSDDRFIVETINQRLASIGQVMDWNKYYGFDNSNKVRFKVKNEYANEVGEFFNNIASTNPDLVIESCSFKIGNLKPSACLDPLVIERLTGIDGLSGGSYDVDSSRRDCMCYGNHTDMLAYDDDCISSCAYCYAKHNKDNAFNYYDNDGNLIERPISTVKGSSPLKFFDNEESARNAADVKDAIFFEDDSSTQNFSSPYSNATDYISWLKGDLGQNIDPVRRDWIAEQINSGALKGKTICATRENEDVVRALKSLIVKNETLPTMEELKEQRDRIKSKEEQLKENLQDHPSVMSEVEQTAFEMNAQTQKDRTALISTLFIKKLQDKLNARLNELNEQLAELRKNPNYDKSKETEIKNQMNIDMVDILNQVGTAAMFKEVSDTLRKQATRFRENGRPAIAEKFDVLRSPSIFKTLSQRACKSINMILKTKINPETAFAVRDEGNTEDSEQQDDNTDSGEQSNKESWQTNYRETSGHESLSIEVRRALSEIPRLGYDRKPDLDDMGMARCLDSSYTHAICLAALTPMTDSRQMIPMLKAMVPTHPWIETLIEKIEQDPALKSKFFVDFNKDFANYYVQRTVTNANGTSIRTWQINKPQGSQYLLDAWNDNISTHTHVGGTPVYKKNGEVDKANAAALKTKIVALQNKFKGVSQEELTELIGDGTTETFVSLVNVLNSLGINIDTQLLALSLETDATKTMGAVPKDQAVNTILKNCLAIATDIASTSKEKQQMYSGDKVDLISLNRTNYTEIANLLGSASENAVEASTREGDKSYYAHVNSSYLGKLMKKFNYLSTEEFATFIEDEYGKYPWFRKNGIWRNTWLELMNDPVEGEKYRKGLEHKILLHKDHVEYNDWDSATYQGIMINEFLSCPKELSKDWAWYHIPIMSDASSAEFIKFKRYSNPTEYKREIAEGLARVALQEYDRIQEVKLRDQKRKEGVDFKEIANYDIVGDNPGGSEFKFFPEFNNMGVEQHIIELKITGQENQIMPYLRQQVVLLMNSNFRKTMQQWRQNGLFELQGNTYKHIPGVASKSASVTQVVRYLTSVRNVLSSRGLWSKDMEDFFTRYSNLDTVPPLRKDGSVLKQGKSLDDETVDKVMQSIATVLTSPEGVAPNDQLILNTILRNPLLISPVNNYDVLENYFWNSALATSQIIEFTATDLAYYKDLRDFQKRYKEIHAPGQRLDIEALTRCAWADGAIRDEFERTVYLKDEKITSNQMDNIHAAVMQKHDMGVLSDLDAATILSKYGYSNGKNKKGKKIVTIGKVTLATEDVNVTDAQAYRCISSYKAVYSSMGRWTPKLEHAFEAFKNGTWDMNDFMEIANTIKPYLYTQVGVNSPRGQLKVGVQHKNSEFLLLAGLKFIGQSLNSSPKLKGLDEFMEKNHIDVVQFESTTKVGKQGVIDLTHKQKVISNGKEFSYKDSEASLQDRVNKNDMSYEDKAAILKDFDFTSSDEVVKYLESCIKGSDGNQNPDVVHTVPYADYCIQSSTEEHLLDREQLIGSQIKKLIMADISPDAVFNIGGKELTRDQLIELYQNAMVDNMLQKWEELQEMFSSPQELEKVLQREIRNNSKYGPDLLVHFSLDENGKFNIPVYELAESQEVQQLFNSIIKKRVTKQTMRGGALIQVSNFGLTEDLHIVFKDSKGNLLDYESFVKNGLGYTPEEYQEWIEEKRANNEVSIAYLECYMPAYSKEFYQDFMDENGVLDINKMPEELRNCIGYRVPTEDKYSMAPLRIKGFLPQQNGGAIMLPSEITTLSGSDFDVDKMYVLFPEFKRRENVNWSSMRKAFYDSFETREDKKRHKNISKDHYNDIVYRIFSSFKNDEEYTPIEDNKDAQMLEQSLMERVGAFIQGNKPYYTEVSIEKIKYDPDKDTSVMSRQARNNLILDSMWAVLTHEDTVHKILNPGGFESQKQEARLDTVLRLFDKKSLATAMGMQEDTDTDVVVDTLLSLSSDDYADLLKIAESGLSVLNPTTQTMFHDQNRTGGKMIGVYANQNANHAVMVTLAKNGHRGLTLNDEFAFTLFGRKEIDLSRSEIENPDGTVQYISRNNAGYLAASVDNVKDNALDGLNQNEFTADASMLLSRLGHSVREVGLLMNHPIVKKITDDFRKNAVNKFAKADFVLNYWNENYSKEAQVQAGTESARINGERRAAFEATAKRDSRGVIAEQFEEISIDALDYFADKGGTLSVHDFAKDILNDKGHEAEVVALFYKIMKAGEGLSTIVAGMRSDTSNGAAGPTIADNMVSMAKTEKMNKLFSSMVPMFDLDVASEHKDLIVENLQEIVNNEIQQGRYQRKEGETESKFQQRCLREEIRKCPLPYQQAAYTLGLESTKGFFEDIFPQYSESFQKVVQSIKDNFSKGNLPAKTLNTIYNELIGVCLQRTSFFGKEMFGNVEVSVEDKRDFYINKFPGVLKKYKAEHPNVANNNFLKKLNIVDATPTDIARIELQRGGKVTREQKEDLKTDWLSLLYDSDPTSSQIAVDLFMYDYFKNGLLFNGGSFGRMASSLLKSKIPDYIKGLKDIMDNPDFSLDTWFPSAFVRNHLNDRSFVPVVDKDLIVKNPEDGSFRVFMKDKNGMMTSAVRSVKGKNVYAVAPFIAKEDNGTITYYTLANARDRSDDEISDEEYEYLSLNDLKEMGSGASYIVKGNIAVYNEIKPYSDDYSDYVYGRDGFAESTKAKNTTGKESIYHGEGEMVSSVLSESLRQERQEAKERRVSELAQADARYGAEQNKNLC